MATAELSSTPGKNFNPVEQVSLAVASAETAVIKPRLFDPVLLDSLIVLRQRDKTSGGSLPKDYPDFPGETFKVLPHYTNSYDPREFGAWTINIGEDSYRVWSIPSMHGTIGKYTRKVSTGEYIDATLEEETKVHELLQFWNSKLDIDSIETETKAPRRLRAGLILKALRKLKA